MSPARLSAAMMLLAVATFSAAPLDGSEFTDEVRRALDSADGVTPAEDAAGAVDGTVTGTFSFHTGQDNPPWWQVDLGADCRIGLVRIYAPHYSERLTNFRLLVSDDGQSWATVHAHGATTNDDRLFDVVLHDVDARYVRVTASGHTWMHLDEVMIFAPGEQQTNLALRRPCSQSSVSSWSTARCRGRPPATGDWRSTRLGG